jgi:hypothetical protein
MSGLQLGHHSKFAALKRRQFCLSEVMLIAAGTSVVRAAFAFNCVQAQAHEAHLTKETREGSCSDASPDWRSHVHLSIAVVSFYKFQCNDHLVDSLQHY